MSDNTYCPTCGDQLIRPVVRVGPVGFCDQEHADQYARERQEVG